MGAAFRESGHEQDRVTRSLSDRQREILCAVVELFLLSGEPVASAAVATLSSLSLSSASIRNTMANLEDLGLLVQPHTSAGRVPSDLGIRVYVARLLEHTELPEQDERHLGELVTIDAPLEEVLAQVSRVLARTTEEVGIAVVPASRQAKLRSIHFAKVSAQRVLAILVTTGGLVDSRLLAVERDYAAVELERISNYCTDNFADLSLEDIRDRLLVLMAEERLRCDGLLAGVVELGRQAVGNESISGGEVFLEGANHLLERAAPTHLDTLRRLFVAFSDKAMLLSLLNGYLVATGPRVVLGSELPLAGGTDLSLVARPFECRSGERGLVGVIGLKRMDYSRIIPIVDFLGRRVAGVGGSTGSAQ
jgi:heat-inducible transcriptional repressor